MPAPLSTSSGVRRNPYQPITGLEGLPFGESNPILSIAMQAMASAFMGHAGMTPMGLTNQNIYDRMQAWRLQHMHDELLQKAAQRDTETYMMGFRSFAHQIGAPWGPEQAAAAHLFASKAASAGPVLTRIFGEHLDVMGGNRGLNVVLADQLFRGSRFRIDPLTGRHGLGQESLQRLTDDIFESVATGSLGRQGTSLGRLGGIFSELQRIGMVRGPAGLGGVDQDVLTDAAVRAGFDVGGGPGVDPRLRGGTANLNLRDLTPAQRDVLQQDPKVKAALASFDSRRVIRSLEDYTGTIEAMQEIFGDAGMGRAPIPELINALNKLTAGAMPQLAPGEVEAMARTTYNLARQSGLNLQGAMLLSQVATQQTQEMGLPPIFASDALQHGLGFRAAFQGRGMGAHPAWGLTGMQSQTMADMQLTAAASQSRLANQVGAALRISDALSAEGGPAFKRGSAAAAFVEATRMGLSRFRDPTTGRMRSVNMSEEEYTRMIAQGSSFPMDQATVQRFLQQQPANLEFVQKYGVGPSIRRGAMRDEFFDYLSQDLEFNAQEQLGQIGIGGRQGMRLGREVSSAYTEALAGLSQEQRSDREVRNRLLRDAVMDRLRAGAAGKIRGVNRGAAARALRRFESDPNFATAFMEEMWGAAEVTSRDPFNPFGPRSLQDALQLFDQGALEQTRVNVLRQRLASQAQSALSPLGGDSAFRRGIEAFLTGGEDTDMVDIFSEAFGGERGKDIAKRLQDSGLLTRLKTARSQYMALARRYEAAGPEERKEIGRQLRRTAKIYKDTAAEIADIAKASGVDLEGAVPGDKVHAEALADTIEEMFGPEAAKPFREAAEEAGGLPEAKTAGPPDPTGDAGDGRITIRLEVGELKIDPDALEGLTVEGEGTVEPGRE